jgi:hypothetical protein
LEQASFQIALAFCVVSVAGFASATRAADILGTGATPEGEEVLTPANAPRPEHGIVVEDWMVYPSFFAGYQFNDNVYETRTQRVGASGLRVNPAFQATLDNGLHKTMVTFSADAQLYPGLGQQTRVIPSLPPQTIQDANPSNVTGGASLTHVWSPEPDFTITGLAGYTRQNGLLGASIGQLNPTLGGLSQPYLASIGTYSAVEQYSNQYTGMLSMEKKLTNFFVTSSLALQYVTYDSAPTSTIYNPALPFKVNNPATGLAGGSLTFSVRGGYWLTPQVYAFVEPGLDIRRYQYPADATDGYRVVAGLGTDMISLFRGEIWGGVQSQASAQGYFGAQVVPDYGARISYFPTPDLTIALSASSTLSGISPTGLGLVTPFGLFAASQPAAISQTQQVLLQADYLYNSYITASIRGGFGKTETSSPATDSVNWSGGATISYNFWRDIALTLNYQFTKTSASIPTTAVLINTAYAPYGYVQNLISVGVTYHY